MCRKLSNSNITILINEDGFSVWKENNLGMDSFFRDNKDKFGMVLQLTFTITLLEVSMSTPNYFQNLISGVILC